MARRRSINFRAGAPPTSMLTVAGIYAEWKFRFTNFWHGKPLGFKTLPILRHLQNLLLPLYFWGNVSFLTKIQNHCKKLSNHGSFSKIGRKNHYLETKNWKEKPLPWCFEIKNWKEKPLLPKIVFWQVFCMKGVEFSSWFSHY